ncbi:hemolysin-III related-domain-containing protein [Geranomyces variabilis]|nr:hemolysin-III related-domain-containing protein [Geranomyces variabilis]
MRRMPSPFVFPTATPMPEPRPRRRSIVTRVSRDSGTSGESSPAKLATASAADVSSAESPRRRVLSGEKGVHVELAEETTEIVEDPRTGEKHLRTTIHYRELEPWQMDNIYILRGYRRLQHTYAGCMRTLLFLHNETGNIFTHLIGSLAFLALFRVAYVHGLVGFETVGWQDRAAMATFLASAAGCMGMSAFFHAVTCHSFKVCRMWNKCDYVGIVLLICGSTVPVLFYGFYCDARLQAVYITMMTIFGSLTAFMCLSNRFATPDFRYIRTANFCALGLSGIFPLTHAVYLHGFTFVRQSMSFWLLVAMGVLYIIGAFIYASRVPERLFPGRFDYWGHSHQIFHCLVVAAASVHYFGVLQSFRFWHERNPRCEIPMDDFVRSIYLEK